MAAVHFFWLALLLVAGGKNLFNRRKLSGIWITYGICTVVMTAMPMRHGRHSLRVKTGFSADIVSNVDRSGQWWAKFYFENSIFTFKKNNVVFHFYFKIVYWKYFILYFQNTFKKYFNKCKILFPKYFFQNTFCILIL